MEKRTEKLHALTGLRFFAAAAIVLLHSVDHGYELTRPLTQMFDLNQAVSFFFILSGFILSYVYPKLEKSDLPQFFLKRFARLWPAHIFAIILVIIVNDKRLTQAAHDAPYFLVFISQALMVHAWIPIAKFYSDLNSVSWSISTEFFFYLCFPFLLSPTLRQLLKKGAFVALAVGLIIAITHYAGVPLEVSRDEAGLLGWIYISPFCRILEFTLGMVTYQLFKRLPNDKPVTISDHALEFFGLLVVIVAMRFSASEFIMNLPFESMALKVFLGKYGFTMLFFAGFIVLMARGRGILSTFLSLPFVVLLGEISYSIYLLHKPVFWGLQGTLPPYPIYWLALITLSYLVWRFIETPMRKGITKLGEHFLKRDKNKTEALPA